MPVAKMLYETLPLTRIGIRLNDNEVVSAVDYSAFAFIIEEYISSGVSEIVVPASSPDLEMAGSLPKLLSQALKVIDDAKEIEAAERLLFSASKDFNVELQEDRQKKGVSYVSGLKVERLDEGAKIKSALWFTHANVKRLAFGFNHGVSVGFNVDAAISAMRFLRARTRSAEARSTFAQLEGLLSHYEALSFGSVIPKDKTPRQLISLFDKLVNDPTYLSFSSDIALLSSPNARERALVRLRDYTRLVSATKFAGVAWDYTTKVLKVWPGVPLPEAKDLSAVMLGREAPTIADPQPLQGRALENWRLSTVSEKPLNYDGTRLSDDGIEWLLPSRTVGELRRQLEEFEAKQN